MPGSQCREILETKRYLVTHGWGLSTDGARLLERVLGQSGRFSIESLAAAVGDSGRTEAAALGHLVEFLVEVGIVIVAEDGALTRRQDAYMQATLRCAVCHGSWLVDQPALDGVGHSICSGSNFLAVVGTLQVTGLCPACRSFGGEPATA